MKYVISKLSDVKFILVHNNANFVQSSRPHLMAHVIFLLLNGE